MEIPEQALIGLGGEYCLETRGEIPRLWWQLQAERPPVCKGFRETTYGVLQAVPEGATYAHDERFTYVAGTAAEQGERASPPLCSTCLQAGLYAVFRFTGAYTEMPLAFDTLILNWLPQSDWLLDNRTLVECYPGYEIGNKDLPVFEIWLPVVPKG
ncbi:MAG: GyrI-like domain-containing protein [Thalassovita sp.]|nr:GyrI-like domain-containing protein [Thalassovita sp.]